MISILICEDDPQKLRDIKECINDTYSQHVAIQEYDNAHDAINAMSAAHFDLLILDIRIPAFSGSEPDKKSSEELVKKVSRFEGFCPSYIIGLTRYSEEDFGFENYPIEYFRVEIYSNNSQWQEKILRHIMYILNSKESALSFHYNSFNYDLVIIAARYENEFKPIISHLKWKDRYPEDSSHFQSHECKLGI